MLIEKFVVGPLSTNCYVIPFGSKATVIDPGANSEKILNFTGKHNLEIENIICTHGHPDHIGAASELVKATGAEIFMHSEDKKLIDDEKGNISLFWGEGELNLPKEFLSLSDGQILKVGTMEFKIIHTPGHTPGSICVLMKDNLFAGDLLFCGSVGRTDLTGGSYDMLMNSIKNKVASLPDLVKIYPGHGPETTLREEKKSNPYLQGI